MSQAPALPFSKIRLAKGLAFLSGEMPFADDGRIPDGIEAQTALVLRRIGSTLATVGLGLDDVVQVAVHLVDGADFAAFNAEYRKHFRDPLPVRTTVVASLLAPGARLEVTVTAAGRD
ncbi:Enamine deaminase RidA, house cleaning of reactive enamine intermediates, YjgF/YER057c/UK114 family [Variovorax sp. HW608]|uniref:RidA family protein n=1 Tax=Variovorax sp. HW608 TaxID=1034889 RepID=UPI0008201320|nr:RidA family protein [Variovorax sp. HW608]SCK13357.1 Enamine deaminase RidA, house cleaning of reactive enamine intermediates, YjgF/YER057c/UK114 family [Variovorax sp. HW608]